MNFAVSFTMIAGLLRHLLTFGGGVLVANGFIDDATSQELVGGLMTVIGIAWSLWQKWSAGGASPA